MVKTTNTETHMAVDERIKMGYTKEAMVEGFAEASGIRNIAANSGGRINKESGDRARFTGKVPNGLEDKNGGTAD